jgi:hypothetical protein
MSPMWESCARMRPLFMVDVSIEEEDYDAAPCTRGVPLMAVP